MGQDQLCSILSQGSQANIREELEWMHRELERERVSLEELAGENTTRETKPQPQMRGRTKLTSTLMERDGETRVRLEMQYQVKTRQRGQ